MRFVVSRDIRDQPHLRWLLIFFTLSLIFYLVLSPGLEKITLGITPLQTKDFLFGNTNQFLRPRSTENLLIDVHVKLFIQILGLLTMASAFLRSQYSAKWSEALVLTTFAACLVDHISLFFAKWYIPSFVWLKVIGFWTFQLGLFLICLLTLFFLLRPRRVPSHAKNQRSL